MYYSICELIKRGADKLVENGALLTDDVAKAISQIATANNQNLDLKDWKKIFTKEEMQMMPAGDKICTILEKLKIY